MARITLSSLITDISGKIGGTVFQRSQGGLIARNQSAKINSNTTRSNLRKVGMAQVQNDWQTLTDAQRQLWNTYAIYLGKKQKHNTGLNLNGHQVFMQLNSIRYDLAPTNPIISPYLLDTPILVPPPQPRPASLIAVLFGNFQVDFTPDIDSTKEVIVCFLSRPLSGSQVSSNQKLTLMKTATADGSGYFCGDYYTEVYGRIPEIGEFIQCKVAVYNTDEQNLSAYSVQRFEVI